MISYLEGKIILKKEKYVILFSNGVGYKVFLSQKNILNVKEEENISFFCFLEVKENALNLYGFLNPKELEFFEILEEIRGVGPKAALEISSLGSLEEIKDKVLKQDENVFSGISGIGKKKAMTIMLELTGKIKDYNGKKEIDIVENSLINLGFTKQEARFALEKVPKEIESPEKRIKAALKILGK